MQKLSKSLLVLGALLVVWYIIDYTRHGIADFRLQVEHLPEDTLLLAPFFIKGDAVYNLEEISISDETKVTGLGFQAFRINDLDDLQKGQWVRVWLSEDERYAKKIVVIDLF